MNQVIKMRRALPVFALVLSVCGSQLSAGTLEAKKDNVDVLASTDKGAAVIQTLKKGETIDAGERSGMYWQVKTKDGKPGFVSVMAVKAKAGDAGGLGNAIRDAVKEGRTNSNEANGARSRSAVMGVRGLDDNDTAMAGSVKPNLRAVYQMEDFDVSASKIEQQGTIIENDIMSRMKK